MAGAVCAATLPAASLLGRRTRAAAPVIRFGVLNDLNGPFRHNSGPSSAACVRQAVEDFGAATRGIEVEVLAGDHQNKPDVGAGIVRQWIDRDDVDVIVDVPHSGVALAVQQIVRDKNKAYLNCSLATSRLTGDLCSPNTIHWTGDTYMLARSTGGALAATGLDTWFLLVADYAFGQQIEKELTTLVQRSGARVLGRSAYPSPETQDFSSFLLNAQATAPKVLALCSAPSDAQNIIKQAAEFGLSKQMRIAALLFFLQDVRAIGLELAQGLLLTETFYWDLNDRTRAWTKRVLPKLAGNYPSMAHAGCYASTLHYLKAVAALGAAEAKRDGAATIAHLKAMPFEDDCFGAGSIRPDGRTLVTPHVFEVKSPTESTGEWDLYKPVATTPAADAFRPLAEGHCPFVAAR
jgi:branched-chain amino acid transport system substrate-binding protein